MLYSYLPIHLNWATTIDLIIIIKSMATTDGTCFINKQIPIRHLFSRRQSHVTPRQEVHELTNQKQSLDDQVFFELQRLLVSGYKPF